MRTLFGFLLLTTALFGVGSWYLETASICPAPIMYRIGQFDERFLIEKETAVTVLAEAEKVWEDVLGRELFIYDEEADFLVNFIFDERQQLARTEEEWRMNLDKKEIESTALIEQVKAEWEGYQGLQEEYEAARAVYEERLNAHNTKVELYNDQGGAPALVFDELQAEQLALVGILSDLTKRETGLNDKAEAINELGVEANALIESYNSEVLRYNELFGSRDLYTQGDFSRDRINVYKFSDETELTKVFAHEFGHALGMGHVEGEESIMYYLMAEQPDAIVPTAQDKAALVAVCGNGTGFSHEVRKLIRTVVSYL